MTTPSFPHSTAAYQTSCATSGNRCLLWQQFAKRHPNECECCQKTLIWNGQLTGFSAKGQQWPEPFVRAAATSDSTVGTMRPPLTSMKSCRRGWRLCTHVCKRGRVGTVYVRVARHRLCVVKPSRVSRGYTSKTQRPVGERGGKPTVVESLGFPCVAAVVCVSEGAVLLLDVRMNAASVGQW
jgi:hypothetical protein